MSKNPPISSSQPTQLGLCSQFDRPCSKVLLAALGVITMIGGVVATVFLHPSLGSYAFVIAGGSVVIGLIPIAVAVCKRKSSDVKQIEKPTQSKSQSVTYPTTTWLDYTKGTPAQARAAYANQGGVLSRASWIPPIGVSNAKEVHPLKVERGIGVMLGMAVGDSVGAPYEFLPFKTEAYKENQQHNEFKLEEGQWTDDASMGLCLADMLILGKGQLNDTQLMWAFYDWWNYGYNNAFTVGEVKHSVGLGGNISKALKQFGLNVSREDQSQNRPTTAGDQFTSGNGSLMRNGPVALAARSEKEARELARRQSFVTHQGVEAAGCCELMAFILYHAIHSTETDPKKLKKELYALMQTFSCTESTINDLAQDNDSSNNMKTKQIENWNWTNPNFSYNPNRKDEHGKPASLGYMGSYAMDGLAMALHCVFTTDSFEAAVKKAALHGGDADTVAAITGQIAGAIYGRNAIPKQWIENVEKWDRGGEIATRGYYLTTLDK